MYIQSYYPHTHLLFISKNKVLLLVVYTCKGSTSINVMIVGKGKIGDVLSAHHPAGFFFVL